VKPQDQPDTIEAGREQAPLTMQLNMSTTSILIVAGLRKIGRKFLGHHNLITSSELSTQEKISITREGGTQAGDEAVGKAKINKCIPRIMKMIQITGQKIVSSF
jgi:hypothetical protein